MQNKTKKKIVPFGGNIFDSGFNVNMSVQTLVGLLTPYF
jgi:hypothetical protein